MITDKIKQKIQEISTPVLLFFDAEQEYREEVLAIEDQDFKVLEVCNNYFNIKYAIECLYPKEKLVLYHPFAKPTGMQIKAYPLANLLFANEELLVDESADLLKKYDIHHSHAAVIMQYKRFVKPEKYQKKLLPIMTKKPFNEHYFKSAILSLLLNEKKLGNDTMNLVKIFEWIHHDEAEWQKIYATIEKEKLVDTLKEMIYQVTHLSLDTVDTKALTSLFLKLKYNILTKNVKVVAATDGYQKLKITDEVILSKIDLLFKEWSDDKTKSTILEKVLKELGESIDDHKIVQLYGSDYDLGLKTSRIIQYELSSLVNQVIDQPQDVLDTLRTWKREGMEDERFLQEMLFLEHTSKYYQLLKTYSDFDFNYIEDYITKYERELYAVDSHYRHAYISFQKIDREKGAGDYAIIFQRLSDDYEQFLIDINKAWLKILEEKDFDINGTSLKKQYRFYQDFVEKQPLKKVIIISDGFRYELAQDLADELKGEASNKISLESMLASIPSYTNLGMSNLLPNHGIDAVIGEQSIDYKINGIKTNSSNREKILKLVEPESVVVAYDQFMKLGLSEQRELLKAKLVYIYHNWMDNVGDKKSSEYYTFESVEQCISQLKHLIKKLYNSLNVTQVYVTADHGFLFNYKEIKENSRQQFPPIKDILKEHTRFCISSDAYKGKDTYTIPLSATTNIETDVKVILPKGINRFRKQGAFGVQFVHGGASLQELVVPVLHLARQRNAKVAEVGFKRLDGVTSIASSMGKFSVLQEQAIGDQYQSVTLLFALYDQQNNLLSHEIEIELNSVSMQPSERIFEFKLELNKLGSTSSTGYLRAYHKKDNDKLNPVLNDLIKINTLMEKDEF